MNRRELLRTLGLGAGGAFLFPWIERTLSHATGQLPVPRRRVIVFTFAGFDCQRFTPVEVSTGRTQNGGESALPDSVEPMTDFTWQTMFSPIEDLRANTLFIDNLANPVSGSSTTHGIGYAALTCQNPDGEPGDLVPPRGQSIDQYLAQTLSANTPKSSLLFGTSYDSFTRGRERASSAFAAGTGQSLAHATKASTLYNEIVGLAEGDSNGAALETGRREALRDALRADFNRLRQRLAGPERERLDVYETAIAEFDRRFELRETLSCDSPPGARDATETSRMESMMDIATLALECGITNVIGVAVGTADHHDEHFPRYDGIGTIPVHDYNSERYMDLLDEAHQFHWTLLRKTLDTLELSDQPDDETFIIYTSARGTSRNSSHHGAVERWPVMMFAKSPNVQLGGRFLRYPPMERSLAEFFRSACQVVGVCPDGFATGDYVAGPVNGLLSEVVGSSRSACG